MTSHPVILSQVGWNVPCFIIVPFRKNCPFFVVHRTDFIHLNFERKINKGMKKEKLNDCELLDQYNIIMLKTPYYTHIECLLFSK